MSKKAVVFVDGENLVMRYQDMVAKGRVPRTVKVGRSGGGYTLDPIVSHVPDSFVWSPITLGGVGLDLIRVNYYTSVVGDDVRVNEVSTQIARTPYTTPDYGGSRLHLIPRVHKKPQRSNKTKVVDVDITMDIMRAAITMPIDLIVLLSGDGDYVPLVREVARSTSKQVWISAFSVGLADGLTSCAENFTELDDDFFEPNVSRFNIGIAPPEPGT